MPNFFKKSDASNDDINPKEMEKILNKSSVVSQGTGKNYHYVVLQVTLKEKLIGTGSKNLSELEEVINNQAKKGYKLHTISTSTSASFGVGGGDRIQATMVFESIE